MGQDAIAEALDIREDAVTRSFLFILGTFLVYLSVLGVELLPDPLGTLLAVLFAAFWLGYPVALYHDRRFVAENSAWTPSRWYYLGFLPGYLGIAFVGYYILKRRSYFEAADPGDEEQ